jgi:hypothetical protein
MAKKKKRANQAGGSKHLRPYGPGKFDTMLDVAVYKLSLDGADEEAGDVSVGEYAALMRDGEAMSDAIGDDPDADVTMDELAYLHVEGRAGVILTENSQGFVGVHYFRKKEDLEDVWNEIANTLSEPENNPKSNPDRAAAKRRCMR